MLKAKKKKKVVLDQTDPFDLIFGAKEETKSDFHLCYAENCKVLIPKNMLMCGSHWQMVPKRIQALVYEHYQALKDGQGYSTVSNMSYRNAIAAARQHVAERVAELKQAGPRPNCPFCLDSGVVENNNTVPKKYCNCTAGQILFKKEQFQQRPLRKKGERVYDAIPFGKHKGVPLEELPIDYLQWAYENWEDKGDGLYSSIAAALYNRLSEVKT